MFILSKEEKMEAYVALGYSCNHSCLCCPLTTFDRLHRNLSKEYIDKQIELILEKKRKVNDKEVNIVISGGEPLLNPNFLALAKKILDEDIHITLLTNASKLSDPIIQEQMSGLMESKYGYKPLQIVTAIHSSNNEIHDSVTRCKGSLWDTLEGLDFAVSRHIPVTIKLILNKITVSNLIDTVCYLDEHFPPEVKIQLCGMDYSGQAGKHIHELFISYDEIKSSVEKIIDYIEKKNDERYSQTMDKKMIRKISLMEAPLCMLDPYYWRYYSVPPQKQTIYVAPNAGLNEEDAIAYAQPQCGAFYKECKNCKVKQVCYGTWNSAYRIKDNLLTTIE